MVIWDGPGRHGNMATCCVTEIGISGSIADEGGWSCIDMGRGISPWKQVAGAKAYILLDNFNIGIQARNKLPSYRLGQRVNGV